MFLEGWFTTTHFVSSKPRLDYVNSKEHLDGKHITQYFGASLQSEHCSLAHLYKL